MSVQRMAISAVFVAGLAALPFTAAKAQYYYPYCNPFPLSWPFCVAGAAVGTAAAIASAPFGGPYYYYYGSPYYYAPAYYYPVYRHRRHRRHYHR